MFLVCNLAYFLEDSWQSASSISSPLSGKKTIFFILDLSISIASCEKSYPRLSHPKKIVSVSGSARIAAIVDSGVVEIASS
jgi:hypothetical protein